MVWHYRRTDAGRQYPRFFSEKRGENDIKRYTHKNTLTVIKTKIFDYMHLKIYILSKWEETTVFTFQVKLPLQSKCPDKITNKYIKFYFSRFFHKKCVEGSEYICFFVHSNKYPQHSL